MILKFPVSLKLLLAFNLELLFRIKDVNGLGCDFCISIWDPFCKEDILFAPYVRVFEKGRAGAIIRDRGPGFIDVSGMSDILVCMNGLVMLYYMKTRGLGEVYEHGELHWAPHHCEMYNPSCNTNGMPGDFPRKTLLSILLIGHPNDYRQGWENYFDLNCSRITIILKPALQMFIAPVYDTVYNDYINITSLIMVGSDGECLIEKGAERARLRVRAKEPEALKNVTGEKPAIFCQLDAQRKLGQKGIITLATPGASEGSEPLFKVPLRDENATFKNSPYERLSKHFHSETGPVIIPRFKASLMSAFNDSQELAQVADDVYAALINDRKMRFVGCLQYPDFSEEQFRIIMTRYQESNFTVKNLNMSENGEITDSSDFWENTVKPPWPAGKVEEGATPEPKKRFELYEMKDVKSESYPSYEEAKGDVDACVEELTAARANKSGEQTIKEKEANLTHYQMLLSLWPYKKSYEAVYKYLMALKEQVDDVWEKVMNEAASGEISEGVMHEKPPNYEDIDNEDNKATQLAMWKHSVMRNISQRKYERRYEPYNRILVDEYNNFTEQNIMLEKKLKQKSRALGPMISNAETLQSKYRTYLHLLKKVSMDLKNVVKHMEKTQKPVESFTGRHPMDSSFTDTMIEIADANSTSSESEGGNKTKSQLNPDGKACFELPTRKDTCYNIRPNSTRASAILRNRKGLGRDWPTEDLWRQKILDLLESIFMKVCPYISEDFGTAINQIFKGYLLADPLGTGLKAPVVGTRLYTNNHDYQAIVYNLTFSQTGIGNGSDGFSGHLKIMDPFWDQIQVALEDCNKHAKPMQFWHSEEDDKPAVVTYRKYFHNNRSEEFYVVEDLFMTEKADLEFAFNWAIDMNWRIMATVLGVCMPAYEKTIPLISARFYALYSTDFLHPLRQIWMSNRDNPVHQVILGNYYGRGRADKWTKICMESSFVESGDRNYRPPRNLYVNAFTEMNYFVTGPLVGTSGILSIANGV